MSLLRMYAQIARLQARFFGLNAERFTQTDDAGRCMKIYQEPTLGEPISKRLFEVIGEDNREPFLQ